MDHDLNLDALAVGQIVRLAEPGNTILVRILARLEQAAPLGDQRVIRPAPQLYHATSIVQGDARLHESLYFVFLDDDAAIASLVEPEVWLTALLLEQMS